jgi:hypothetical protein
VIVAISGSRKYPAPQEVLNFLYGLAANYPDVMIVSGGRGIVDTTAETYARKVLKLPVISFRPVEVNPERFEIVTYAYGDIAAAYVDERHLREINSYHRTFAGACYSRNIYIISISDRLTAFWDGESPGTRNAIEIAGKKPIPISVKRPGQPMQLAA